MERSFLLGNEINKVKSAVNLSLGKIYEVKSYEGNAELECEEYSISE